ncbi:hypothetical protein QUC31_009511 [Theobroma cacao]
MQKTLQFKPQFLHLENNLIFNPFLETTLSLQSFNCSSKSPIFTPSGLFSHKTQIQKPIICARKSRRRYGSERSTKFVLELISILASNLKILPQPLDLVVESLVGADGGGLEFLNGFKGGSFTGWRRRTRRTNWKKILGFLGFLGFCVLCLLFGKELRSELLFGGLGFGFFLIALIKEWRRGLKDWIFGFCCVAVLVGLGLRGNEAMKWIKQTKVSSSSPMVENVRRGKRGGRWAL